ncbi:MAG: ATP-binding protein [Ilumatobacter sp.]
MDEPEQSPAGSQLHYLERELRDEIAANPDIFKFIEQSSLEGLWYWDLTDPEHEWMSPEFWVTLGVDPETMPHRADSWQELINAEDLAVALDNFEKHCADPNHPYDQTVRYLHADGSTVWVRCRGMAIRDENGRPTRMLGAHNDITAERQALVEARGLLELERQKDALAEFVQVTAHDLRSPLNTMAGHLDFLSENYIDTLPEEGRALLAFSLDAAQRMLALLDSLKPFTRSFDSLDFGEVDLDQMVADVWNDLSSETEPAGAVLVADNLGVVRADRDQLRIVFQNIISNSIKFRGFRPPTVTVERATDGADCVITVRDNGRGVDAATSERAFDLFFRGALVAELSGGGTGLTLCERIVRRHGGSIAIEPVSTGGAVVTIRLPGMQ